MLQLLPVGSPQDTRQNDAGWLVHLSEDRSVTDLGAVLSSDAQTEADTPQPGPPQPEGLDAACFADASSMEWKGPEARKLERFPVQGTRPIALRLLQAGGAPATPWVLADILDISLGGLCLVVSGPLELPTGQALELDLRSHPAFARLRLTVEARWCRSADSFTTFGIAFPDQLSTIPHLSLERRGVRRDPNEESWASE